MKLADDAETARWLESLATPEALEWDRGNRTKSEEKHGFSVADVESIFARPKLEAGRIVEPASGEKRYLLLGDQLPRDAAEGEREVRCGELASAGHPGRR